MIITRDNDITIITQEKGIITDFVKSIENDYDKFRNYHLIVVLSSLDLVGVEEVIEFLRLSNSHRGDSKSFVIVSEKVNLEDIPDELVVVPTRQEAYDIIEMENIERDLGF